MADAGQLINFVPCRRLAAAVGVCVLLAGCAGGPDGTAIEPQAGAILNGRAAVVYSTAYEIDLFGMELSQTYDLRKNQRIAGALIDEGYLEETDLVVPPEVTRDELLLVHSEEYIESLKKPINIAKYLDQGAAMLLSIETLESRVLSTFRRATGGTILAARHALASGLAMNLGGGYHHAHPDHGGGFCLYADVPIAVRVLQKERLARRILVVDCSVNQGNGIAVCLADDKDVFTFDIHEAKLWPKIKAKSDLDVGLDLPVGDAKYLATLRKYLPGVIEREKPELVIYVASASTQAGDPNGHFEMTPKGIRDRDETVVGLARRRGIPVLYITGGGYSLSAWAIQFESIKNLLQKFAGVTPEPPREVAPEAAPTVRQ